MKTPTLSQLDSLINLGGVFHYHHEISSLGMKILCARRAGTAGCYHQPDPRRVRWA